MAELPGGGEARPGQREMADAVRLGIAERKHVAVQAGTGTGKTLAYLVPAILSRTTHRRRHRHQGPPGPAGRQGPPVPAEHLDHPFDWAVLKGRSNYLCMQRLAEMVAAGRRRGAARPRWRGRAGAGRRSCCSWPRGRPPPPPATGPSSTSSRRSRRGARSASARGSAPAPARCPSGGICFAEAARNKALEADVVVVNLHLYALDLGMGGVLLDEHELAVIDEAHQLEDIVSATCGVELTGGRFTDLARRVRGVIADDHIPAGVDDAGRLLTEALRPHRGNRIKGALPDDLAGALTVARGRVESALAAARNVPSDAPEETRARALRVVQSSGFLLEDARTPSSTSPPTR